MFCTNCGKPIPEGAAFCPNCGAANQHDAPQQAPVQEPVTQPVQPEPQPQAAYTAPAQPAQPEPQPQAVYTAPAQPAYPGAAQPAYAAPVAAPAKKKTGLIVGICAGGVVVIAAIVVVILWLTGVFGGGVGGNSPTAVANQFINAITNPNGTSGQEILDLLPEELVAYGMDEGGYSSEAEMAADLENEIGGSLIDALDELETYGGEYSFTVGAATPVDADDLEDIQSAYQEVGANIAEAQTVEVDFNVSVFGEEISQPMDVSVVKVGNRWYLDVYSMS